MFKGKKKGWLRNKNQKATVKLEVGKWLAKIFKQQKHKKYERASQKLKVEKDCVKTASCKN